MFSWGWIVLAVLMLMLLLLFGDRRWMEGIEFAPMERLSGFAL